MSQTYRNLYTNEETNDTDYHNLNIKFENLKKEYE